MTMTDTQVIVNGLLDMGCTKWEIKNNITARRPNKKISWRTIDAWSKGEWSASKDHMVELQDFYFYKCKEMKVGLFAEDKR